MSESLTKIQKLVIDFLDEGQVAHSESLKALHWIVGDAEKKRPNPGEPLRYLNKRVTTW
jgi:hypothetical protein